ncbi:hypothetical protein [Aurantimicrobium minutum]|uniref:hypothetical protein n=1 Tax=Aurantimicrobium minutum TaxID=708131 RepID=UPI002474E6B2|nr:hypothetical protein [Aurantimicrobium minutum]MDH6423408.1 hypothetical protein [Aurantimicrobium minutum]
MNFEDELEIEDEALELASGGTGPGTIITNSPITTPGGGTYDPTTGHLTYPITGV